MIVVYWRGPAGGCVAACLDCERIIVRINAALSCMVSDGDTNEGCCDLCGQGEDDAFTETVRRLGEVAQ